MAAGRPLGQFLDEQGHTVGHLQHALQIVPVEAGGQVGDHALRQRRAQMRQLQQMGAGFQPGLRGEFRARGDQQHQRP